MVVDPADLLRQRGIQVTAQRLAVLRAVAGQPHITADGVAEIVRAEIGAISLQSVYDALSLLASWRPDVLIADIGLPKMDGFELIRRVRDHADEQVHGVPAAALTAYARSEDRLKALSNGFQLHLTKPIDPAQLMAAVAMLARRQ